MPSFRRVFGAEIDPALRPLFVSVGFGALGQFAFFAYFAIWALTERAAGATQVGLAYSCAALAAVVGSILGGRVADGVGRRPVIVAASVAQAVAPAVLLVPGLPVAAAYGVLVVMGLAQPMRGTAQRAFFADVVADSDREEAYGAFRVVLNAGATLGPLGGAALVTWRWEPLFVAIVAAYVLSSAAAWRLPESRRPSSSPRQPLLVRRLLRDGALIAVFFATVAGWCAYSAFEVLTPIALTETHGLGAATWGVLFALNPVVIVALQLRVTRLASRVARGTRLAVGVLLMALPYLVFELGVSIAVVAAVVLVFVFGEMLWAPASEALVASIAPAGWRGVYLGTANAASWLGMALAPAAGLQARAALGDGAMWALVAAIGVAGAVLYVVASRPVERSLQESDRDRPPLRHADEAHAGDAPGDGDRGGRRRAEAGRPDGQPARAARC